MDKEKGKQFFRLTERFGNITCIAVRYTLEEVCYLTYMASEFCDCTVMKMDSLANMKFCCSSKAVQHLQISLQRFIHKCDRCTTSKDHAKFWQPSIIQDYTKSFNVLTLTWSLIDKKIFTNQMIENQVTVFGYFSLFWINYFKRIRSWGIKKRGIHPRKNFARLMKVGKWNTYICV